MVNFTIKVACGSFVKRQTEESGYSHFIGTWDELALLTSIYLKNSNHIRQGYRDGVVLVDLPVQGMNEALFYSAIVSLDDKTKLNANYSPRRNGEAPYIRIAAKAQKQPAKYASVVLYRWDVLEENNERETYAEWEIVAIKARVTEEEEPMDPYTMARNFLHLEGGTKGDFTVQQFAESIVYWNQHTMCSEQSFWHRWLSKLWKLINN